MLPPAIDRPSLAQCVPCPALHCHAPSLRCRERRQAAWAHAHTYSGCGCGCSRGRERHTEYRGKCQTHPLCEISQCRPAGLTDPLQIDLSLSQGMKERRRITATMRRVQRLVHSFSRSPVRPRPSVHLCPPLSPLPLPCSGSLRLSPWSARRRLPQRNADRRPPVRPPRSLWHVQEEGREQQALVVRASCSVDRPGANHAVWG